MPNKIFAFIGTTAAGKTYYSKHLVEEHGMHYIPSVTTRPPRPGNLAEYKHVSRDEFEHLINAGQIFEYATHNGHYYGKLHTDIDEHLRYGHCVYTITADRVAALKEYYPNTVVICVTVAEPIVKNTAKRLIGRGHNEEEILAKLTTIESDIREINRLKNQQLIDYVLESVEGDTAATFHHIDNIAAKHT